MLEKDCVVSLFQPDLLFFSIKKTIKLPYLGRFAPHQLCLKNKMCGEISQASIKLYVKTLSKVGAGSSSGFNYSLSMMNQPF
ncbi:MAG: hypothetical protein L6Q29_04795 [Candidatus Pacebacteria bacterium]|nr:hypothetical protein [Candidatus Paceibacterota bacterium]NUQ57478.1 hypothetical protein [Candidatus Paceibacter sp.]